MNEQKENDLMLNIPPIIKHQIEAEDDNRRFNHDNTYDSCCFRCDKRALQFIVQALFSAIVIIFTVSILLINQDCDIFTIWTTFGTCYRCLAPSASYEL